MPTRRRMVAYSTAMLGSVGIVLSLWLPWYSFRIPTAAIDQATRLSQQFGVLGPLIRQSAELARTLGPLHLTAWQALRQSDILIAVAGVIAGGLALLAYTGRARGVGRGIEGAAALGLVVIVYRAAVPPGPDGFLHTAWGAYAAGVCAAAAVVAGLLAAGDDAQPEWGPPAPVIVGPPSAWDAPGSVAPPML